MLRLPVMVAAGGVNSAGRTSRRHAYRRMIWDHLSASDRAGTQAALNHMMGRSDPADLLAHTLVREIEADWFDYRAVPWNRRAQVGEGQATSHFEYTPGGIGEGAAVGGISEAISDKRVRVTLPEGAEVLLPSTRHFDVSSAGQLPTGFDPGALYASRNHPRALQMTVFAISDALADLGIDWQVLEGAVPADAIGSHGAATDYT